MLSAFEQINLRYERLDGAEYRMFGMDGTGGQAAFWCVRPNVSILDQPIIFLGSEGQLGVVANDFRDYLWLLAGGFGPYEAVSYPDEDRPAQPEFTTFAIEHASATRRTPAEILARARNSFPEFEARIQSLCR